MILTFFYPVVGNLLFNVLPLPQQSSLEQNCDGRGHHEKEPHCQGSVAEVVAEAALPEEHLPFNNFILLPASPFLRLLLCFFLALLSAFLTLLYLICFSSLLHIHMRVKSNSRALLNRDTELTTCYLYVMMTKLTRLTQITFGNWLNIAYCTCRLKTHHRVPVHACTLHNSRVIYLLLDYHAALYVSLSLAFIYFPFLLFLPSEQKIWHFFNR